MTLEEIKNKFNFDEIYNHLTKEQLELIIGFAWYGGIESIKADLLAACKVGLEYMNLMDEDMECTCFSLNCGCGRYKFLESIAKVQAAISKVGGEK